MKPSVAILGAMVASETTTLPDQYAIVTERCGLFDRSERGKLALTGAEAIEFLNGQITNELTGLQPGEGRYAAFLTHKGKMLGDLRILVADSGGELLLDTERSALQALFDMIRRFKVGYAVELHKRTLESSLLSLIGPQAGKVAGRAFALDPERLPTGEHGHLLAHLDRTAIRLIATDLGIDVLFDSAALETVRAALEAAGACSVDEQTAEIVRVEHGRPRFGIDLDESTIPQEAGLNERAVNFTKGCYVGQETVARLYYRGKPNRHLRGLRFTEPVEAGVELRLGERAVGHVSSAVASPRFGAIGLALVRREADPGATVTIGDSGATAVVTDLPFS